LEENYKHMKALKILVVALLGSFIFAPAIEAQDWANLGRFQDANLEVGPPSKKESRVVFMGNSITEKWGIYDSAFFSTNPYINRGISGQVTSQMLIRFRPDVIQLQPEVVVILAGTNDIAQNQGPITLEQIAGNIFSMAELARANGIKVVLCSVLPAISYSWRPGIEPADQIVALNKMIKDYAKHNKIDYVDFYASMVNADKGLKKEYGRDTVHPNLTGYRIMETMVEKAINEVIN
jgi:alpha-L-fucosidase